MGGDCRLAHDISTIADAMAARPLVVASTGHRLHTPAMRTTFATIVTCDLVACGGSQASETIHRRAPAFEARDQEGPVRRLEELEGQSIAEL